MARAQGAVARYPDRPQRHRRHQGYSDDLPVAAAARRHTGQRCYLRRKARRGRDGADGQTDNAGIRRWRPFFDLPAPPARNPWNTDHFTAGSSSGTGAGVAAGLILGGIGTDTGGSIRGPAALCGIAGIKPTYGLVSRAGVAPAAFSLDHIGPMAWTAEDCALMLQALAGHDPRDPASASRPVANYTAQLGSGIKGLRIGVVHHFHETDHKVSEGTQRGITAAIATLRHLGAEIREVQLSPLQDWLACGSSISITERAAAYEEWARTRLGDFSERVRSRLMLGAWFGGGLCPGDPGERRELRAELQAAMADLDVVLTAAQPAEAARIDAVPAWDLFASPSFTMPFNVAGYPAISVCWRWRGCRSRSSWLASRSRNRPRWPTPLKKLPNSAATARRSSPAAVNYPEYSHVC